jgi:BirA family biotin operon repressor/biotin-[acetyl-CoA-carboxylase] ligase
LTLVAGLATVTFLDQEMGVAAQVKWPNDIWFKGRKLGGILSELQVVDGQGAHVILGLGLNVNAGPADFSPELAASATSLAMATGRTWVLAGLAEAWCGSLESHYRHWLDVGFAEFHSRYEAAMAMVGDSVQMEELTCDSRGHPGMAPARSGVVRGVDIEGRLLLEDGGQVMPVAVGEVVRVCYSSWTSETPTR